MRGVSNEGSIREKVAYIGGRIETQLEAYANDLRIPYPQLAQRLANFLLGSGQGVVNPVPSVRDNPAKGSKTVATVEMAKRTYSNSTKTPHSRLKNGDKRKFARGIKAY